MMGALAVKTTKKPRSKEITLKYQYKQEGEPIEKILREAIVQHIRREANKQKDGLVGSCASCSPMQPGWSHISGGTTCIQK